MDQPIDKNTIRLRQHKNFAKGAVILTFVILLFWLLVNSFVTSINRVDIRTAKVFKTHLKTDLSAGGTIVPINEETIASHINSRLSKVFVQAGQTVTKGQLLLKLDNTDLTLKIANMNEEIALKENQVITRHLDLTRTNNEQNGKLELLAIDLESRQTKLARLQQLSTIGGVSQHDLTEAKLNVKRTQIEIRQLQQRKKDSAASTIAQIEGLKLEQSIVEKSRQDQLRLLAATKVVAANDGLIVWLKNDEGSAVKLGEPLVKIADTSAYKVAATISDFYANQLWQGMKAEFSYDNQDYFGTVNSIIGSEQAGILSLAIKLDTAHSADYSALRQKQRVDISLITGIIENALVLTKGPFINGSGLKDVFIIKNELANRSEVNIGAGNRDYYQIKTGLAIGDEVIISDVSAFVQKDEVRIN